MVAVFALCTSLAMSLAGGVPAVPTTTESPAYDIRLSIDPMEQSLSAEVGLHVPADEDRPAELVFFLDGCLVVDQVTLDSSPVPFSRPEEGDNAPDTLTVTVPEQKRGRDLDLAFRYGVTITRQTRSRIVIRDKITELPGRHAAWYPRLRGLERLRFSVTASFPANYQLTASGLVQETSTDSGRTTVRATSQGLTRDILLVLTEPLKTELAQFLGREYRLLHDLPENADATQYVDDQLAGLYIIRGVLGDPLNDAPIRHLLAPRASLARGYHADNLFVDDGPAQGEFFHKRHGGRYVRASVIMMFGKTSLLDLFELAHLWFDEEVSEVWWLRFGMPQFLSLYATEVMLGEPNAADLRRVSAEAYYRQRRSNHPLSAYPAKDKAASDASLHVFHKGASVLSMLRYVMDLEGGRFFPMLREFYGQVRSGAKLTEDDLRRLVNQHAAQNMDWFFEQWVFGTAEPKYEMGTVDVEATESGYSTTLTFRNAGTGRMPVQVELAGAEQAEMQTVWLDGDSSATLTFETAFEPKRGWIDPNRQILERNILDNFWPEIEMEQPEAVKVNEPRRQQSIPNRPSKDSDIELE